jgi:hypothetical protein
MSDSAPERLASGKIPKRCEDWLSEMRRQVAEPARLTLIGSGALLWRAFQRGITDPLPEHSMDVDPITDSDQVARLCYEALSSCSEAQAERAAGSFPRRLGEAVWSGILAVPIQRKSEQEVPIVETMRHIEDSSSGRKYRPARQGCAGRPSGWR